MHFKQIFVNRYSEVRVGWRLLSFVALLLVSVGLIQLLVQVIGFYNDFVARILTLVAALFISYFLTRVFNRKPFGAFGLSFHPHTLRQFGMGFLLGFLMISGIFLVEWMSGYAQISWRGFGPLQAVGTIAFSFFYFGVAASLEEVVFRGYFFQTLIQWITFLPATLVISVLFAYGHLVNPHAAAFGLVNVALASVWLSVAYMKTRGLWLPIGLHFAWNFSQTALYGFPTSGIRFGSYRVFDVVQQGPEWITGGAFGPEGGALATTALVVCTWYILKSEHLKAPEGIITLDSVEDLLPKKESAEERSA